MPLLIAAIAAATAFLFIAITMAGRRRRRKRGVSGEEEEEEEGQGWGVDNIMDLVWIGKGGHIKYSMPIYRWNYVKRISIFSK